jgi:hypothetical protein
VERRPSCCRPPYPGEVASPARAFRSPDGRGVRCRFGSLGRRIVRRNGDPARFIGCRTSCTARLARESAADDSGFACTGADAGSMSAGKCNACDGPGQTGGAPPPSSLPHASSAASATLKITNVARRCSPFFIATLPEGTIVNSIPGSLAISRCRSRNRCAVWESSELPAWRSAEQVARTMLAATAVECRRRATVAAAFAGGLPQRRAVPLAVRASSGILDLLTSPDVRANAQCRR